MISITADLGERYMANQPYNDLPAWVVKILTAVTPILVIFGAVTVSMLYDGIQESLKGINTSITAINITLKAQGELLARIEEKFKYLDHRVELLEKSHYESKAKAAGFKDPQIVPTSLIAQEKFDSKPIKADGGQHFLRYTILGYDSKSELLRFRVDSIIRSEDGKERLGNVQGNILDLSLKIDQQVRFVGMFGELRNSMIFVQVIARPSPNRAILAIGEKTNPEGKTS